MASSVGIPEETSQATEQEAQQRQRKLTELGQEQYIERVHWFNDKITKAWQKVELEIRNIPDCDTISLSRKSQNRLCLIYGEYRTVIRDFTRYLEGIRSSESTTELRDMLLHDKQRDNVISDILQDMDTRMAEIRSQPSSRTRSSQCRSYNSSRSLEAAQKAKAEAAKAKARLNFIEKEKELKIKQVTIETELKVLKEEQIYNEATAEAEVYETLSEWPDNRNDMSMQNLPVESNSQRTKDYVESLPSQKDEVPTTETVTGDDVKHTGLNPNAPVFSPVPKGSDITTELSRFLLRKDLMFSRLTKFDDHPENYFVWKSTFKSTVLELGVCAREELDLLVKWLGPDSVKHGISIRASSTANPENGLQKLWERLDDRFGSPEIIEASLKRKLENFPKLGVKDARKLFELVDIVEEILSYMQNTNMKDLLSYFNTSGGVIPIVNKLPDDLKAKWTTRACRYKNENGVPFPPFWVFVEFVKEMTKMKNDPGFKYEQQLKGPKSQSQQRYSPTISVNKTSASERSRSTAESRYINTESAEFKGKSCPYHNVQGHTLNFCRSFKSKPISVRKKFIKDRNICFKCCEVSSHRASECRKDIVCDICKGHHATALHHSAFFIRSSNSPSDGGEGPAEPVVSACARVCGSLIGGRSCAKVVCVNVYHRDDPEHKIQLYALLDDQSNRSLVRSEFFDEFKERHFSKVAYSLSSCAGKTENTGRRATGFVVESLDGSMSHDLPSLTECSQIPDVREEIPTPEIARAFPHLSVVAESLPEFKEEIPILLLIGRDLIEAHHVLEQRIGPKGQPFAQKLTLGWVIIGETCLGRVHIPTSVNVNKTYIGADFRGSIFPPCHSSLLLKDIRTDTDSESDTDIFRRTADDDKKGTSVEDREFISIMSQQLIKTSDGHWSAPLPFRTNRQILPNNRDYALRRAYNLKASLCKNKTKLDHFVEFMSGIFKEGHAEVAPPVLPGEEVWYLPIFGVYNQHKPGQVRVVFDSSAVYRGQSLNSVLLQGPDLANSLVGVLMRFRQGPVAVISDIKQMFFQFRVHENHRNYLRFFWYDKNNPDLDLIEYRMSVHVFGNSPSPAIATFALRRTVREMEPEYGQDVRVFVERNFYVDDGLGSFPDAATAIDVIKRTQKALKIGGNLRLHKIASNDPDVRKSFPKEDLAKGLINVALDDKLPTQRSLGLNWDINTDSFTYTVSLGDKPLTHRGLLSVINSLYDPLGFIAPVILHGKLLLRLVIEGILDWDQPIQEEDLAEWVTWRDSLHTLEQLKVPRCYVTDVNNSKKREVCIFSDASEKAIAAVAYLTSIDSLGVHQVAFLIGKSKVAPKTGHTIPRLELCAAVLAVELGELVAEQLETNIQNIAFYTDSRIVLGYIHNTVKRFYVYVQNRVARILSSTSSSQWHYVDTRDNPADQGTRPLAAHALQSSMWINGPGFLKTSTENVTPVVYELQSPDEDKEIRPTAKCLKTISDMNSVMDTHIFDGINDWGLLLRVVTLLKMKARGWKRRFTKSKQDVNKVEVLNASETFIIQRTQMEAFSMEMECLKSDEPLPKNSPIRQLNPYIDGHGILRVGGRLRYTEELTLREKHPIILPKGHFVSRLIALYYHGKSRHQGCQFTEGAIRSAGFWLIGAKRLIRSLLGSCVKCRKLRGEARSQLMADLPEDRITPGAPFSSVGVDVFGPWEVVARRTRGGAAHAKRWAVLYTCLTSRAIHIEVIEELSSSSFINATRRFIALRGPVTVFRSDRGTNFVGATDCMEISAINVEDASVKKFLDSNKVSWLFNTPYSSHMGGVWERLIGIVRRILVSMMAELSRDLTHEVLTTFMAEICSIVNSRPLVPISTDPDNPMVLSPMMLLTQKPVEQGEYSTEISLKDMYKAQWRRVKCLSNMFWKRWRTEFLQNMQRRRKWVNKQRDLQIGDIVLVIEEDSPRNCWPMGIVTELFPSRDGHIRKVAVKVHRQGEAEAKTYTRPITKLIMLIECDDKCY